ncbi:hypothetical protein T07_7240 [Trichinella nelsoni]|uniref:Uncharacterized protein n=1 Tax=Trichinella nelsoni TaxID=6336 RepID=A0A0V0SAF7_9BILA|nr:hypothetical protein T07_7240 [Trichinella nelsoni]
MKLQKQPVGWLVVWLAGLSVGWLVGWLVSLTTGRFKKRVLETGYKQNPSMETFLAVNKKTAWAISRSAMRAYSIYQLAGTERERETENRSPQTHYLIDTAALESTEAEIRAVERAVDSGCLFLLIFDTVDAASGQLNNLPNTLARYSRILHSQNSQHFHEETRLL